MAYVDIERPAANQVKVVRIESPILLAWVRFWGTKEVLIIHGYEYDIWRLNKKSYYDPHSVRLHVADPDNFDEDSKCNPYLYLKRIK